MEGLFLLHAAPTWINHVVASFSVCGSAWILLVCVCSTTT